ncbi:MAG TPA: DUF4145 domain-containing protein [Planctomycetota bacterium]|nr:DUF4145 domain-containing protein [Planctomycetota bacterium]
MSGPASLVHLVTCPFCMERGNFKTAFHAEKKHAASKKRLNFDTLECGNCKGYVMCLWSSGGGGGYDYRVLPYPLRLERHPEEWPKDVGRFWLQAHRNLTDESWDAAAVMARSALQVALREQKASGANLKLEIADLATKGGLPPVMREWSDSVRELGNDSAHPKPGQPPTDRRDAADIVRFLDFFLECVYTLPHRIGEYRARNKKKAPPPGPAP